MELKYIKIPGENVMIPADSEFDAGNGGSSKTISWANGVSQALNLDQSTCSITLSDGKTGYTYILRLTQGSGGNKTVTWGSEVKWPNNVSPALSTDSGKVDILAFYYDGSYYNGSSITGYR